MYFFLVTTKKEKENVGNESCKLIFVVLFFDLKDILQHFKFVSWRIGEFIFDVTNRLFDTVQHFVKIHRIHRFVT